MCVGESVDGFGTISFGDRGFAYAYQIVWLIVIRCLQLGEKSSVLFIEEARQQQMTAGLDAVFRFVGMVDLVQ